MSISKPILIVGAGGALGQAIAKRLRAQGRPVIAGLRSRGGERERFLQSIGCEVRTIDLARSDQLKDALADCDGAIFVPILSLSKFAASYLNAGQSAVFFSSHNVCVDFDSPVYQALRDGESEVFEQASQSIILRPTMIYGYAQDGNISQLMRAIRRFPVLPVFGGRALQQPVFFDDLAVAAVDAVSGRYSRNRTITVAGPDIVAMASLYRKIGRTIGRKVVPIPLPAKAIARIFAALEHAGIRLRLSAVQLRRANINKFPAPSADLVIGNTALETGLQLLAASLDEAGADA